MNQTYIATYKRGPITGKLLEFKAASMDEAIGIVKAFYRHIQENGTIITKDEKNTELEAFVLDEKDPNTKLTFQYFIRRKTQSKTAGR
ncbi:hypothetical protein QTG56_24225 (plasmid) [Rossellomorea sp. AcN35-11]|nr:hypothetical protein [Rossellomorea aquimaris]WJV31747.1 hypothetical protein QTG56_24225 [Rossellomorea sp. AcN35-11]